LRSESEEPTDDEQGHAKLQSKQTRGETEDNLKLLLFEVSYNVIGK